MTRRLRSEPVGAARSLVLCRSSKWQLAYRAMGLRIGLYTLYGLQRCPGNLKSDPVGWVAVSARV